MERARHLVLPLFVILGLAGCDGEPDRGGHEDLGLGAADRGAQTDSGGPTRDDGTYQSDGPSQGDGRYQGDGSPQGDGPSRSQDGSASTTPDASAAIDAKGSVSNELPAASKVINVSTDAQLQSVVKSAKPGDHIVLADGKYATRLTIDRQGTAAAPIVIRAKNLLKAHLAQGFDLTPASRHIWIYGVDLKDSSSALRGEDHVLRRVRIWPPFNDGKGSTGVKPSYGKNARIDYCEIRLYTTDEVKKTYGKVWDNNTSYGGVQYYYRNWGQYVGDFFDNLVIERCLLTGGPHDVAYAAPNSQFIETSGTDQSGTGHDINWVVRDVYGDVKRDRTLIDFKYRSLNLVRVHIKSPGGAVQVRSAGSHSVRESRFDGAAITINAANNTIENTHATAIKVLAGDLAWDDYSNFGAHRQAYNAKLYNTSGKLTIGYQFSSGGPYSFPALNTLSEGHQGTVAYGNHKNTTVKKTSSVAKKTPVTLDASVVGPLAPWVGVGP